MNAAHRKKMSELYVDVAKALSIMEERALGTRTFMEEEMISLATSKRPETFVRDRLVRLKLDFRECLEEMEERNEGIPYGWPELLEEADAFLTS